MFVDSFVHEIFVRRNDSDSVGGGGCTRHLTQLDSICTRQRLPLSTTEHRRERLCTHDRVVFSIAQDSLVQSGRDRLVGSSPRSPTENAPRNSLDTSFRAMTLALDPSNDLYLRGSRLGQVFPTVVSISIRVQVVLICFVRVLWTEQQKTHDFASLFLRPQPPHSRHYWNQEAAVRNLGRTRMCSCSANLGYVQSGLGDCYCCCSR